MTQTLQHLVFWHWWIIAAVLLIFELLSMTTFFFWLSIAAGATGLIKLLIPSLTWKWQLLVFAGFVIITVYIWKHFAKKRKNTPEQEALNNRAKQNIGQILTLTTDITDGKGKAMVGDSPWIVNCDEPLKSGDKVKVISTNSTILNVEKLKE